MSSDNPIGADNQQETSLAAFDPGLAHRARHTRAASRRGHAEEASPALPGILRDCTRGTAAWISGEGTVRSPWRHGESGRNVLTTGVKPGVTTMPKVQESP